MSSGPGYFQHPCIHGDEVVFVSEGELWSVAADGGIARRLTDADGTAAWPWFDPDGKRIAFTSSHEGRAEAYVMDARGGLPERISFLDARTLVRGWLPDGRVLVASNGGGMCQRELTLFAIDPKTRRCECLELGPSTDLVHGPGKMRVLARHSVDLSYWKRYRGGTAGDLWIDREGRGKFEPLLRRDGNYCAPFIVGKRVHFIADHEGVGNIYSCTPTGRSLKRHTDHEDFYVRGAASDGERVVYAVGGELRRWDPSSDEDVAIEVDYASPRRRRQLRRLKGPRHVQDVDLHPKGQRLAVNLRGRLFTMANWEGAVTQWGERQGVRYRFPRWLRDGERLVAVSDAGGEEHLEVLADGAVQRSLAKVDVGEVRALAVSPKADLVALSNQRNELMLVPLSGRGIKRPKRADEYPVGRFAFSPDGRWLAYSRGLPSPRQRLRALYLYHLPTGKNHRITEPVLVDDGPAWDPEGKYLYFLSCRVFEPAYDAIQFDLGFPYGLQPCLVTLRKDLPDPFRPREGEGAKDDDEDDGDDDDKKKKAARQLRIDLAGIAERVQAFPVGPADYGAIAAIKGKALYTVDETVVCADEEDEGYDLRAWDFAQHRERDLVEGVRSFRVAAGGKHLVYRGKRSYRVIKAGEKGDDDHERKLPGRRSGWIDLARIRYEVDPAAEWRQIFAECWRLQREHYWTEDMSKVDWRRIHRRYERLLPRIGDRRELNDLLWEMQGELGTSHAYVMGGEFPGIGRGHGIGRLGADFAWDSKARVWRIAHVHRADSWDRDAGSPLARPGLNLKDGDRLLAVAGRKLDRATPPASCLVGLDETEVELEVAPKRGGRSRRITVETLDDDFDLRYRTWVDRNRAEVHRRSKGRIGYVHIPNMMWEGFAEFHRGFLAELDREALIVDVRFNGGGHVSQLLLSKLARKRIGVDQSRWRGLDPYPSESPPGPMVCLTNRFAGSDGDIFSHCFKLMGLGPLIGTRTWGGVVGINPRRGLIDGGVTTQPEFSFHFDDVGWGVENYGTDPDIEVDIAPQDHRRGKDPQLDRGLAELRKKLPRTTPKPRLRQRPDLSLPRLPPRE